MLMLSALYLTIVMTDAGLDLLTVQSLTLLLRANKLYFFLHIKISVLPVAKPACNPVGSVLFFYNKIYLHVNDFMY